MAVPVPVSVPLLAVAGPSPLWYLTRGTGLVALMLLTLSVVLGVVNTGRWAPPGWPRFATAGLHRNVSLLVVVVLAIHIITAELDTFAPVGRLSVVIPFASAYRPIWLGLGTLAFDLLLALVVTSLARQRIGPRVWRAVHWAAYASWPLALVHGLGTGTDPRTRVMQVVTIGCAGLVLAAIGWRIGRGWRIAPGRRLSAATGAVVVAVIVAGWAASGPLKTGWARRAGTPANLTASSRASSRASTPAVRPLAPAQQRSWTATLAGTLRQSGPDASDVVTITVDCRLTGSEQGTLRIVLTGLAADGGVSLRHSDVTLDPTAGPRWTGQVTALDGEQLAATLTDAAGAQLMLAVNLQVDPSTQAVTGAVTASPPAAGQGS
jgi:sulfoxide reductase heme-binding subunit YedZ